MKDFPLRRATTPAKVQAPKNVEWLFPILALATSSILILRCCKCQYYVASLMNVSLKSSSSQVKPLDFIFHVKNVWMLFSHIKFLELKYNNNNNNTKIQYRRNPIPYKQTCISTGFKTTTTTSIVSTYQTVAGLVETPIACHKATCSLVQSVE